MYTVLFRKNYITQKLFKSKICGFFHLQKANSKLPDTEDKKHKKTPVKWRAFSGEKKD